MASSKRYGFHDLRDPMPFGFPCAKTNQNSHDQAAQGGHADHNIGWNRGCEGQNIFIVMVKEILCTLNHKSEKHGAVSTQYADDDGD